MLHERANVKGDAMRRVQPRRERARRVQARSSGRVRPANEGLSAAVPTTGTSARNAQVRMAAKPINVEKVLVIWALGLAFQRCLAALPGQGMQGCGIWWFG